MSLPLAYLTAFIAAFATAFATVPLWNQWCRHTGLMDEPGHRKIHGAPIPLAGGLAIMTALTLPARAAHAAVQLLPHVFGPGTRDLWSHGLNARAVELATLYLGGAGMLLVGVLDDRYELRPAHKFLAQLLVAVLVAAAGIRITLFVPSLIFSYAITVLWILTVINAFNFIDNMNGLCSGLGVIGSAYFLIISAAAGQYLVALLCALTCGAMLGFLPHNFPRARAFLGDAGSHLIGYLLAVLAVLPHFHTPDNPRALAVLTPLLVLAVPLGDLVWVVILRWRIGQPFYVGDNNHLSHRLVRRGWSRTQTVLLIWCLAAALGALALL